VSAWPLAAGDGQFDRKGNFKKANIEYRIMNIECRMSKEGILSIF